MKPGRWGKRVGPGPAKGLALAALLLGSPAGASAMDDLISALKRARVLSARGQAEVTVLFPPRTPATRPAQELPAVAFHPGLIERNFAVSAQPDTLAGRDVTRFELTPKVGQAARWTLWVDREWNVPLAFEERDVAGSLARRAVLSRVNKAVKVERPVPGTPAGLGKAIQAALPGLRLPAGFAPVAVRSRAAGGLEIGLTDGLNVLALIVAPRGVKAAPGVASRKVGAAFVWLVGNLPQEELDRALGGVRQITPEALGTFLSPADSNP